MDRKSCRSVQLLLGCSLYWRMHRVQSLPQDMPAVPAFRILSFCTLPSVLRALTGCNCTAGEAHSTPRKGTLRHSVVTSLLSPSKMSHQKLSQTSCSGEPHLPAELHCCCNELQLSWPTYNKDSTKTQVPGYSCYSWSWREIKTRAGEVEILLFTCMT